VRDANLAALVAGLESTGRLEAVGRRAAERLGRDVEVDNRAGLVSVLLRLALNEVASEEVAAAKAGRMKHLVSQDDENPADKSIHFDSTLISNPSDRF
jgi:hypothetical protein